MPIVKPKYLLAGISIMLTVGLTGNTAESIVQACTTVESCQQEIKVATEEREKLESQINDTKTQTDALVAEVHNLQLQVATYNAQIEAAKQTITMLDAQSQTLQASMKKTEGILSERLVAMQLMYETNQSINFIANSSSVTDMIERAQAVNDLTESDRELVQTYDEQNRQVIENKSQTEKTKVELEGYKASQEKLIQVNAEKIEAFKQKQATLEAQTQSTKEEQALSESQLQAIEDALVQIPVTVVPNAPTVSTPQPQQPSGSTNTGSTSTPNPAPTPGPAPTPNPAPTPSPSPTPSPTPTPSRVYPLRSAVLTAAYGENYWHAIPHNGTDYAPRGDATLYSMVDGVVVANRYNSARGWLVAIAFKDGSGTKTLLYQHMASAASVPIGATVTKGQRVGVAGNSGMSSGVHLHVEVGDAGAGGKWVDRGASAGPGLYATEKYFNLPYSW